MWFALPFFGAILRRRPQLVVCLSPDGPSVLGGPDDANPSLAGIAFTILT